MGRVIDIRGWDKESHRSVANVDWFARSTNVYRLGHKGICDIKFVEPSFGGTYYPEHLPILRKFFIIFYCRKNENCLKFCQFNYSQY